MTPGWQTLLAALGGLTLGLGLGLTFAYRRERRVLERLFQARARVSSHVLPYLERRAERLGVAANRSAGDEIEKAAGLASALTTADGKENIGLSDTVDVSGEQLRVRGSK